MELDKKYRKSRIRLNLKYIANQGWNQKKLQKIKDQIKLKVYSESRMALDKNYRKSRIRLNLNYIANQRWNQIKIIENQGLD